MRLLLASLLVLSMAAPALGQPPGRRGQPRVIELEEIVIEGTVQKPNAFYILSRSNLGYEVMDLRRSFIPELVRSVQREPF